MQPKRIILVVVIVILTALNVWQAALRSVAADSASAAVPRGRKSTQPPEQWPSNAAERLAPLQGLSPDQQKVVDDFHKLFYAMGHITWDRSSWLGVESQQNPNDVWVTQEILNEVKPDLIVETGTYKGGSAVLWSSLLEVINPEARIVTIDIDDQSAAAWGHPLFARRVTFIKGSSTAPDIVNRVREMARGKKTLVILDSDHSASHVLAELRAYKDIVSPGSYLIVQDTNVNGHPVHPDHGPGPMEAVEKFLGETTGFVPDRSREKFLFTMHPRGYLRRVS